MQMRANMSLVKCNPDAADAAMLGRVCLLALQPFGEEMEAVCERIKRKTAESRSSERSQC